MKLELRTDEEALQQSEMKKQELPHPGVSYGLQELSYVYVCNCYIQGIKMYTYVHVHVYSSKIMS